MKCAMEVLEIKKNADAERAEQERIRKIQAFEAAKPATLEYAEEIISQLCELARNGKSLSITRHFDPNADGLYRQMYIGKVLASGEKRYCTFGDAERSILNMNYLKEVMQDLCYNVSETECRIRRNPGWTDTCRAVTFSIPSSLPCN